MIDGTCEKCRYWKPYREGAGECYRNAPLPYIHRAEEETLHKKTRWPLTDRYNVCGEFEAESG